MPSPPTRPHPRTLLAHLRELPLQRSQLRLGPQQLPAAEQLPRRCLVLRLRCRVLPQQRLALEGDLGEGGSGSCLRSLGTGQRLPQLLAMPP